MWSARSGGGLTLPGRESNPRLFLGRALWVRSNLLADIQGSGPLVLQPLHRLERTQPGKNGSGLMLGPLLLTISETLGPVPESSKRPEQRTHNRLMSLFSRRRRGPVPVEQ